MKKKFYLLCEDENGRYQKDDKRYNLLVCSWVEGQRANDFKEFSSLEEALAFWGLTEVENANEN